MLSSVLGNSLETLNLRSNGCSIPCERCGRPATDQHHALLRRSKRHPERDHPYNLEWLCRECHEHAGGYEARSVFFWRQYQRYGVAFLDWWDGVSIPAKERF